MKTWKNLIVVAIIAILGIVGFVGCEDKDDDPPPDPYPILRGYISEIVTNKQIPIYQLNNGVTDAQAIATAEKIQTGYTNADADKKGEMRGWIQRVDIVNGTNDNCTLNGVISAPVSYPTNYRNLFDTTAYDAFTANQP